MKNKNSEFSTTTDCIICALQEYFNKNVETTLTIPEETFLKMQYLETHINDLLIQCNTLEKIIISNKIESNNQLLSKDEQLKTKDQQIFSLIAVQKDLTEKATEQVKLLSEKIGSKKWYQFWK